MYRDEREFVLADIPGLIEGAHEGHGLGDRFLGHIERCRVLLHLIDATGEHAGRDYKIIRKELEAYGADLAAKPEIVALTKTDAVDDAQIKKQRERLRRAFRAASNPMTADTHKLLLLSSATGAGVTDALRALAQVIDVARARERAPREEQPWSP